MRWTTLIGADELAAVIDRCLVVDARHDLIDTAAGRRDWAQGHLPGAVFVAMDDQLSAPKNGRNGRHPMPEREQVRALLAALGLSDDMQLVVYDGGNAVSGRLWWMAKWIGHDAVAVLDGGLRTWRAEGRPVQSGSAAPAHRAFTARLRPELVRDVEAMRANVVSRAAQVLDARSAGRFAGTEPEPRAGLRGGHIPGSLNLPYETLYRADGTLKAPDELRGAITAAGVDLGRPVVTSCGSGVTASVLALALYLVGRPDAAVYDGSWSEWGSRSDTPVET